MTDDRCRIEQTVTHGDTTIRIVVEAEHAVDAVELFRAAAADATWVFEPAAEPGAADA